MSLQQAYRKLRGMEAKIAKAIRRFSRLSKKAGAPSGSAAAEAGSRLERLQARTCADLDLGWNGWNVAFERAV